MNIRAKMTVSAVTKSADGTERAQLVAVTSGNNPEDNNYSKWTPSANLDISITNPSAQGVLVPGRTFYVDFSPVPEPTK